MKCAILLLAITCVWAIPLAIDDPLEEFVAGNHVFTAAIYQEVVKQSPGNLVVSPFSVETVLALTFEGANGVTATELSAGLSLPSTKEKTEIAYRSILPKLKSTFDNTLQVSVANKIYVETGVKLEDSFRSVAVNIYGSDVETIEFRQPSSAAAEINEWVEEETNHKIRNLISPNAIDPNTEIILVNALYLSGQWATPFTKSPAVKQSFYTAKDHSVPVDTMHNEAYYNYYESEALDAKFLELPLKGGAVSMVIVLPNQVDGLASLEQHMTQVLAPQKFELEKVYVDLPKFTIESQIAFVPVLKSLGIQRLFTSAADLTGLSSNEKDFYVSDVIQKAFINVTESGIEAAAATTVIIIRDPAVPPVSPVAKIFKADHPFAYYVKYDEVILFSGRYIQPKI